MNEYTFTEISSNFSSFLESLGNENIDENNIVWSEKISGDNDFEIFLYNGSETIQLTNNDVNDFFPQISDNNVVWQSQIDSDGEIFLYNGSETIQLTNNDVEDFFPAISGENVVWSGSDGRDREIFLYDGSETIQLTDNDVDDFIPKISGDNVVWQSQIDSDGEIFLYDGSQTIQLTDNDVVESFEVSENNVVLSSRRSNDPDTTDIDVFLYNGNETIQLNNNSLADGNSEISGDNVVWTEYDGNDFEVFLYDGSATTQLTDNDLDDIALTTILSGSNVVWSGNDGNDFEVFLYNGSETTQLTDNDIDDRFVKISDDNNIVWQQQNISESGEGPRSIFLATSGNVDPIIEASTVYRFLNNDTGVHFYTANETEKDAVEELANFSFEGASYQGLDPLTGTDNSLPVYRFLNQDTGVHLYTIDETEKDAVEELANFSFEGEVFDAYDTEVDGSIPIYRFFNSTTGAHFYTPSATERDAVLELADYQSEGIAYYALPLDTEI